MSCRYEYLWADGKDIKKPMKVSAPEYADYLMTWVQNILEDETVFPTNDGECVCANARSRCALCVVRVSGGEECASC